MLLHLAETGFESKTWRLECIPWHCTNVPGIFLKEECKWLSGHYPNIFITAFVHRGITIVWFGLIFSLEKKSSWEEIKHNNL